MKLKIALKLFITLLMTMQINAQITENSELFKALKANDSLLFEVSFNKCQLQAINHIMAEDLEFYHDQGGITNSKEQFMSIMKRGICNPENKTKSRRALVKGSLKVFPLYNNGTLYGALQNGEHKFFESYNNQAETAGSVAKFSHLWLKVNDQWVFLIFI